MAARADNPAVAFSEKVFERLLAAYPKAHREEYGAVMAQLFRDQCRDAWSESRGWGLAKLWLRVLPDVIGTSLLEHLETVKERKFMLNRISALFRSAQSYKFFTVFAAVFLLVVITVTVATFILPESFAGTARISVRKVEDFNTKSSQTTAGDYDPYFIQTQFEVLQSRLILQRVVQRLGLRERWANRFNGGNWLTTRAAIDVLGHSIDFRPIRNTSLIEIRAYSYKPEEAAELANATAEAYRDYRAETSLEMEPKYIREMRDQLENQQNQLSAALSEVDRWRKDLNISDSDPQNMGPVLTRTNNLTQSEQAEWPYWKAKRKLADLLQSYNALQMKIASAEADLQMPKRWPVEIDRALPQLRPIRPNKPMNIIAGIFLGTLLGLIAGAGVAGISFLSRRNSPPKIAS